MFQVDFDFGGKLDVISFITPVPSKFERHSRDFFLQPSLRATLCAKFNYHRFLCEFQKLREVYLIMFSTLFFIS